MKMGASRILIFSCICFFNSLICYLLNRFFFKSQFSDIAPANSIINFIVQKIPDIISLMMYLMLVVGVFMLVAGLAKLITSKKAEKQKAKNTD